MNAEAVVTGDDVKVLAAAMEGSGALTHMNLRGQPWVWDVREVIFAV